MPAGDPPGGGRRRPACRAGGRRCAARRWRSSSTTRALQSPEYGGGPARDRYVPGGRARARRAGAPAWTFESRTLIEFPPAVDDGLVVVGRQLRARLRAERRHRADHLGAPPEGRRSPRARPSRATRCWCRRWTARLVGVHARPRHAALALLAPTAAPIESSPLVVDGRAYVGTWSGRLHAVDVATGPPRLDLPGARRHQGQRRPGRRGLSWWATTRARSTPSTPHRRRALDLLGRAAVLRRSGGERRHDRDRRRRRRGHRPRRPHRGRALAPLHRRVRLLHARRSPAARSSSAPTTASLRGARPRAPGPCAGLPTPAGASPGRPRSSTASSTRPCWRGPGRPARTFGLDVATGAVRYRGDDGRYSPAVGAGTTLYLVGTRHLRAHPARRRRRLLLGAGCRAPGGDRRRRASSASACSGAGSTPRTSRARRSASSPRRRPRARATPDRGPSTASTPRAPAPTRRSPSPRRSGASGRTTRARCSSSRP